MKKAEQAAGFAVLDWQRVEAHLPEGWRELADEMKLIRARPAHMETKVSKIGDVLRLILHYAGAGATLRETVALAATLGILGISHVALHKWMRKAGPYLARLLSGKVGGREYCAEKWAGYEVIAGDATTVQRPGSLGTTARVHYALRLSDLSARQIEVTDDKEGETARRFRAEAGELWLLDRVYCTPPSIAWLQSRGADVIVRFNRGSLPLFDAEGHRINVDRLLDFSLVRQVAREVQVFVHGPDDEVIPARVCWLRLPPDKVEESKLRLQRQSDNTPDAEALVAAEYVIVLTTVPASRLSADRVLELYRARWQIELAFKRAKSIGELDKLPNFRADTIHSWICAKLLLHQIAYSIAAESSASGAFPPGGLRNSIPAITLAALPAPCSTRPRGESMERLQARVGRRVQRNSTRLAQ